jgi:Peptidase inhibitor I9
MRVKSFEALLVLVVLTAVVAVAPASQAASDESTSTYIVQLVQAPAASYEGGVAGHPATKPSRGSKLDKQSSRVRGYTAYLDRQHSEALAEVGGAEKLYDYTIAFNGFAAKLTDVQAKALEKVPGVLSVEADVIYEADTATTPHYVGLDSPHGLWQRLGGVTGKSGAGEDMIIGVIDSGITPESVSFTDRKIKPNKLGKVRSCRHRSAAERLGEYVPNGRGMGHVQLQQQADRRPLLQLWLRRRRGHQHQPPVGVQLTARLQRPRYAYDVNGRR